MIVCHDFEDRPDCLRDADDRFTMRFDDIGKPPLYWCAHCGVEAHAMNDALVEALATRGPEFAGDLEASIAAAERPTKCVEYT